MSDELVHAILPPPDLARFRELTGVGNVELEVSFSGWSKLAILTSEQLFLFPRRGRDTELLHGAMVCEELTRVDVECVPRVLGRWPDGLLSPGPFVAFENRPGTEWSILEGDADLEQMERVLRSLGGSIASWHRIDVSELSPEAQQPFGVERSRWVTDFLHPTRAESAVDDVVRLLAADAAWASTWGRTVCQLSTMAPVLLHGDVHEGQLLVDESLCVRTVLDWDTAGVGHPLFDFDFGEWGIGIFAWEAEFPRLRRAMWESYRLVRGDADLPSGDEVNLLFTLAELAYFTQCELDGRIDEWGAKRLALLRTLIDPVTEAVSG